MATSTHKIEDLIVSLEDVLGFPLGWKVLKNFQGGRSLALSGKGCRFPHEAQTRSEFTGYIQGIIDGYKFAHDSNPETEINLRRLRLLCKRARAMVEATDRDIFTDAPECQEAVKEVAKTSADIWALIQSMPFAIRKPDAEALDGMQKQENLRQKELEAIQLAADLTDRTIGADEVQVDLNSEVEFVEGGAWVSIRVYVSPDEEPGACEEKFENEPCLKPRGHTDIHVSKYANWAKTYNLDIE